MRCEAIGIREELADAVVDLGRFERAQSKPHAWDFANQALDEHRQRGARVHAVVADVNACQDDLGMMLGQVVRLVHECSSVARSSDAPRQRRCAEGAVLIAPVLNPQERARSGLHVRRKRRCGESERRGDA